MRFNLICAILIGAIYANSAHAETINISSTMRLHGFENYPLDPENFIDNFDSLKNIILQETGKVIFLAKDRTIETDINMVPIVLVISEASSQFAFTQKVDGQPVIFINASNLSEFQNLFSTSKFPNFDNFGVSKDYPLDSEDTVWQLMSGGNDKVAEFQNIINDGFISFTIAHEIAHVLDDLDSSFGHLGCSDSNFNTEETSRKSVEAKADSFAVSLFLAGPHFMSLTQRIARGKNDYDYLLHPSLLSTITYEERVSLSVFAYIVSSFMSIELHMRPLFDKANKAGALEGLDSRVIFSLARQLLDCGDAYNTFQIRNLRNMIAMMASIELMLSPEYTLSEDDLREIDLVLLKAEEALQNIRAQLLSSTRN